MFIMYTVANITLKLVINVVYAKWYNSRATDDWRFAEMRNHANASYEKNTAKHDQIHVCQCKLMPVTAEVYGKTPTHSTSEDGYN